MTGSMSNDLVISQLLDDLCFGVVGTDLFINPDHDVVAKFKPTDYPQDNAAAAYVFTNRPLKRSEWLTVQIQDLEEESKAALGFGVTSCDPFTVDTRQLPSDWELLYDRPEYWVIDKTSFVDARLGDELRFFLTESPDGFGEIRYAKNGGLEKTLMCVDYTVPLWPFFELGKIREMKLNSIFSDRSTTPNIVHAPNHLGDGTLETPPGRPRTAEFTAPKTEVIGRDSNSTSSAERQRRLGATVRRPAPPPPPRMPPSTRPTPPPPPSHPQTQSHLFASTPFVLASGSPLGLPRDSQSLDGLSRISISPRPPPPVATKPVPPTAKPSLIRPLLPPLVAVSSTPISASRPVSALPTTSVPIPVPCDTSTVQGRSKEEPTSPTSSSPVTSSSQMTSSQTSSSQTSSSVTSSSVTSSSVTPSSVTSSSSECTICMDTEVNCVIYTCGHMCACYECAVALKQTTTNGGLCPICRQTITDVIKIYKS